MSPAPGRRPPITLMELQVKSLICGASVLPSPGTNSAKAARAARATLSRGKMVNATISVVAMVNARLGTNGDTNEAWPKASGQRRLVAATLADYADPARCHADSLCLRVHAMEPTMPIAPKLADGIVNPCIETKDGGLHNPVHP